MKTESTPPVHNVETVEKVLLNKECRLILREDQLEEFNYYFFDYYSSVNRLEMAQNILNKSIIKIVKNQNEMIDEIKNSHCSINPSATLEFTIFDAEFSSRTLGFTCVPLNDTPEQIYVYFYSKLTKFKRYFELLNTHGSSNDQYYDMIKRMAKKLKIIEDKTHDFRNATSLTLAQLYSIFVVLLFGLGCSCILFIFIYIKSKLTFCVQQRSKNYTILAV